MKILKYKSFFLIVVIGLFLRLNSASPPTQEREKPNWRQSRYLIWPDLIHPDLSGLNNSQPFQLSTPLYKEGEVLVKFKSRATETQIKTLITLYGSRELKKIPRIDVYQLEVPHHQSVHEMVNLLRLNPEVEFAEPNYYVRLAVTPNDPLFRYQ
ncbi:MAG: hypothetical protein N3B16_08440, partial [Candidatus Aminicenantes bacterium]|nr:hypothetical protein [Candidatus Aminicenantes bacterium]